jgi:hypothetical protein
MMLSALDLERNLDSSASESRALCGPAVLARRSAKEQSAPAVAPRVDWDASPDGGAWSFARCNEHTPPEETEMER